MIITFKNKKLKKTCNSLKEAQIKFGTNRGKQVMVRLDELEAVVCLEHMKSLPHARCHELSGRQKGQFTVDIEYPYRLVFKPDHDPVPLKSDGGIDLKQVTSIKILAVENTHGK